MAGAREVTQFSMVEFGVFKKGAEEMGVSFNPTTPREKHMAAMLEILQKNPDFFKPIGGIENVARIRVIEGLATDGRAVYDPVLKLPLHIIEQKRREADQELRRKQVMEKAAELAKNPKALDEFVTRVAVGILGRAAAELLRASKQVKATKALSKPKAPRRPPTKDEAFEAAKRQDRRNRIEAAKAAAAEFHKNKAAPKEAR